MLASSIPTKFPFPFANSAGSSFIRPVPIASQIGINPGAASDTDGFVPLNFLVPSAGGIPPDGRDVNGILNQMSAWDMWQSVGGPVYYDAVQSTAIGGYPQGALLNAVGIQAGYWWSEIDNNTSDPDTGGANWFFIQLGNATTFVPVVPATTWFVDGTNGTDAVGQGLSSGTGAFKTGQFAINTISNYFSSGTVTVNFAAATYASFSINQSLISSWNIVGAGVGSTAIQNLTAGGIGFSVNGHSTVTISAFAITAALYCIAASQSSVTAYNCNFIGTSTGGTAVFSTNGSFISLLQPGSSTTSSAYNISGSFSSVLQSSSGGQIIVGFTSSGTFNHANLIFGTTTVSAAVVVGQAGSIIIVVPMVGFSGSTPTGTRYFCSNGGGIDGSGGGYTFIPGTVAGSPNTAAVTSTGGWYAP